jgi:thioredoxin 1
MSLPIITEIRDRSHFAKILESNPGLFIIKFGAEWCGPCKKIENQVKEWIDKMPNTVQCAIIDVDESFDVYAFLKTKKMVNGIPAILCYELGNLNYIPNDAVIGSDVKEVDAFFQRCLSKCV